MSFPFGRSKLPPRPDFSNARRSEPTTIDTEGLADWHSPVLLGAAMVGARACQADTLDTALRVTSELAEDAYSAFVVSFYTQGAERFGADWHYADISTVLVAASGLARPGSYLEIGVRRGRSMAMVSSQSPRCEFVGFDMWITGYGGNDNPGGDFVEQELRRLGHEGPVKMIDGDSHETVPAYFAANPDAYFDLITVDGDHSRRGAMADLECVIPRLKVGGILVFDDICHPAHPELAGVWAEVMRAHPELSSWEYADVGFGVAVAVRKY